MNRRAFLLGSATVGMGGLRSLPARTIAVIRDACPIIDTHQHLWDLKKLNLPWLANAPPSINRTFLIEDFRSAAAGLNVVKTVYMEVDVHPAQQVQEAEFAISLCRNPGTRVAGAVIGGYPQEKGFADYLKRFSDVKCVKGVRTVLHGDRPRGLCLKPEFINSMKLLADAGLSFDLCLRPGELHDGVQLAMQCRKTTFILDHCGNIGLQSDAAVQPVWREGIKALAAQPNVVCKISGLIDKAGGEGWSIDALSENINLCLDEFGEDRVLFGGDWPVCLLGGTYRRWVNLLNTIVCRRPLEFQKKLFHDNALRVYRLG